MYRVSWALLWMGVLTAHADTQYWVAVGSYSSMAQAQKGLETLEQGLVEPLSVAELDTNGIKRYRVLLGPYSTESAAETGRSSAKRSGVEGAWIVRPDAVRALASTPGYVASAWSTSYRDYPELNLEEPAVQSTTPTLREKKERVLVKQAPADYQLHRLRRQ